MDDLLPSDFHRDHSPKAFTVCYLNESREGDTLLLSWDLDESLRVEAERAEGETFHRVFAVKIEY